MNPFSDWKLFRVFLFLLLCNVDMVIAQTGSWGSLQRHNNTTVQLSLLSRAGKDYESIALDPVQHSQDLKAMLVIIDGDVVANAAQALNYAALYQSYLEVRHRDMAEAGFRAIRPGETQTYSTLSDPANGNYFSIRLPYDGGFNNLNNQNLVSGPLHSKGLQNPEKRRALWKDVFTSAIFQAEMLSGDFHGGNNQVYQELALQKILTVVDGVATGTNVAANAAAVAEMLLSSNKIPLDGDNKDIEAFLNAFSEKVPDAKFKVTINGLQNALVGIEFGTEIASDVLKTMLLRTLLTAEAESRLNELEQWMYSPSPGHNDSEIANGFEDARAEFYAIRDETLTSIGEAIQDNKALLLTTALHFSEQVAEKVFRKLALRGIQVYVAKGVFFVATALIKLRQNIDEQYDVLRLASLSAILEEYLTQYLSKNYSSIPAHEENIKSKIVLSQIISFLGFYYFSQIRQVYDNRWYDQFGVALLINLQFFAEGGVTKEALMAFTNEGIARNKLQFNDYCEPFNNAKNEINWFKALLKNPVENISPTLQAGSITPSSGSSDQSFSFKVKLTSGAAPEHVNVVIDGNHHVMTAAGSNWIEGVSFTFDGTFSPGVHACHFEARANSQNLTYPSTGSLTFHVTESAQGWDIAIDPLSTKHSPSSIRQGTKVLATTEFKNQGNQEYSMVPAKIQMHDPDGVIVDSRELLVLDLWPGTSATASAELQVPVDGPDGLYRISFTVYPDLDSDASNNSRSTSFFIGETLGNEQFRATSGPVLLELNDKISVGGHEFEVVTITSQYAKVKTPSGTFENIYSGTYEVYGNYDAFLVCEGTTTTSPLYAQILAAQAIPPESGATFDDIHINASPGTTVYAYANAPEGFVFESDDSDYALLSSSNEEISDWYDGVAKVGTYARIAIEFDIPADIPLDDYTLYIQTKYAGTATYDFTQVRFHITSPPPSISALSQTLISADDQLVITGSNLGSGGTVKFNDLDAENKSWDNASVVCIVPENVATGIITIVTATGTSNNLAYQVYSPTGVPIVTQNVPDQRLLPNEAFEVGDLTTFFSDPNGGDLTFTIDLNTEFLSTDEAAFSSEKKLQLTATENLIPGTDTQVTITATDPTGKSISESFSVAVPQMPSLWTATPRDVGKTSAIVGGTITSPAGTVVFSRGVCWSATPSPTIGNLTAEQGEGPGTFEVSIGGLEPGKTYYISTFAFTSFGIQYGPELSFTTQPEITLPSISTREIQSVARSTAISGGNVFHDGHSPLTARGVCWSESPMPTINDNASSQETDTGPFESLLTALVPGTTYFVRAYATNELGTAYGNIVSFSTLAVVAPTIITMAPQAITGASALLSGEILSEGGDAVTERGFCFGLHSSPTIEETKITVGAGMGAFSEQVIGLTPGTVYYVKAYGTNASGTAYGEEFSFATLAPPVISSIHPPIGPVGIPVAIFGTGFGDNPASVQIAFNGAPAVVASLTPTQATTVVPDQATTGGISLTVNEMTATSETLFEVTPFCSGITELTAASGEFADGSGDFAYSGNADCQWLIKPGHNGTILVNFTSLRTQANVDRITVFDGGTISDNVIATVAGDSIPTPIRSSGNLVLIRFQSDETIEEEGWSATYEAQPYLLPTVMTKDVVSRGRTTASVRGLVSSDGGTPILSRGICWSTTGQPTTADLKTEGDPAVGEFIVDLSDLFPGTTYYFRAYATNAVGTAYGDVSEFSTLFISTPVITTSAPDATGQTSGTGGGIVTSDGGDPIIARGICWNTNPLPTTNNAKTVTAGQLGAFTATMSGLNAGTTYYVRAYAINSVGTEYGAQESFTTDPVLLPILTTKVSNHTALTASVSGIIDSDGGGMIFESGICWNTVADPTIEDNRMVNSLSAAEFTFSVTAPGPGDRIYARAYAINVAGPGYGNLVEFVAEKIDQQLEFLEIADRELADPPFALVASSTATGSIQFFSQSGKVIMSDNTATIVSAGRESIIARHPGDHAHKEAEATRSFCINPAPPVLEEGGLTDDGRILISNSETGTQWYWNGTPVPGAEDQTFEAIVDGKYTATVTIDGCVSAAGNTIELNITGVEDSGATFSVELFPNPATTEIKIDLRNFAPGKKVHVVLQNLVGRRIERHTDKGGKIIGIPIHELSSGPYIIRVSSGRRTLQKTFLKE